MDTGIVMLWSKAAFSGKAQVRKVLAALVKRNTFLGQQVAGVPEPILTPA